MGHHIGVLVDETPQEVGVLRAIPTEDQPPRREDVPQRGTVSRPRSIRSMGRQTAPAKLSINVMRARR
jgi:hypothetical protein